MTHTPGPWTYNSLGHVEAISSQGVQRTAEAEGPDYATRDANARLIAAAPETAAERDRLKALNAELLEALKAMVDSFNCPDDGSVDGELEPYFRKPVKQARAAIAKATA